MSKVVLVTGGSSGIGAAVARAAVAEGHRVALAARTADKLAELVAELGEDSALAVTCDVNEWVDQQRLAATVIDRFGAIDVAFANAGFGCRASFDPAEADPVEHWRDMILTNVYGAALTVRAVYPALRESKGHLVLTGSVAGRIWISGSLYSSTKWAITAMGEAVRQQLQGSGVRVTVLEPGYVDSPFWDEPRQGALSTADVAEAFMYAISRPPHVDVNEVLVRPVEQVN